MRTFLELREYSKQNLQKGDLSFSHGNARFQVYNKSEIQLNISINKSLPVIKFEERYQDFFTVAVATDEEGIINYAKAKKFSMNDNIVELIKDFPDGFLIDDVVSALLSIKIEQGNIA